ncbi:MAG: HAMP domain-containing histidine kinase [Anaerolineales bacterium]|uniref:histidine kinase n=1 Tax=Candidatus Desulfolinea nitratireducens TaxID=2841698 RepID=A0A8J6NL64_9CHLR|nr:HAMP domain-containing histidine kinase [Candidatus Desulfolinea nitratireducens]MBL6959558.1 HAMP domain-containing histidine kinase [Anaerolineales bacterium]
MRWRWWWVLIPFIFGIMAALAIILTKMPNPILFFQADLWILVIGVGIGLSILMALITGYHAQNKKTQNAVINKFSEDRNRFLRRLDHELKNPLTAILAGLANLSVAETPTDRSSSLNSVQTQVGRLRRLVAELRKLSELETRPLDLGPIDLTVFLEDAFELAKEDAEAGKRNLTISIPRAPWPLPTINGDRDLLILAIHNLLENSFKFTESGDTIEMRAFEDGTRVVIEIADTGPGIPEDDQLFIWEELYRGKNARGIPGSGLGLALVRAIITRHRGDIAIRSRSGEGTVFSIHLPG